MADKKTETPPPPPEFSEVEGHELLVDPRTLKPSQAMRLLAAAGIEPGGDVTLDVVQRMMEEVEESYLTDEEAYTAFYRKHGLGKVIEVVGAFLGELLGDET